MKKSTLILFCIIGLAALLRFVQLGATPSSPDWDEVALGYNAYSLLHTGKDEYGTSFPLVLRSFNDYKPALYAYFTIPSIALFDLTVFAVRFPSALFGVLTVLVFFYLVKELFRKDSIALVATFLLAISPWHLQFSRTAFEANLGLSLIVFCAYFFIKGLRKNWLIPLSALCAGLSLYAYQSEKIFIPIFVLFLLFLYRKSIRDISRKTLLVTAFVFILVSGPLVSYTLTNPQSLARAKGTVVLMTEREKIKNDNRYRFNQQEGNLLDRAIDSRFWVYGSTIVSGYFSHFDPNWLFMKGDNPRHHAFNMGILYYFELPLLLIGIYALFFDQKLLKDKRTGLFIAGWIFISPIAPAVTDDVPHAVRSFALVPMIELVCAIGLVFGFEQIRKLLQGKRILFSSAIFISCLLILFNFVYYLNQYYVQSPYFDAKDWQFGYREVIQKLEATGFDNQKIVVSDVSPLDQSYIFFLFYTKFDPATYQEKSEDFTTTGIRSFGKYTFRKIDWEKDRQNKEIVFVGSADDFSGERQEIGNVFYPNSEKAFEIVRPL